MRNEDNSAISTANMESNIGYEQMGKDEGEKLDKRVNIHIESLRYRLADPDGISGKAAIDGLVSAGILPDDSAGEVKAVTYSQKKVSAKNEAEITIITLEECHKTEGKEADK